MKTKLLVALVLLVFGFSPEKGKKEAAIKDCRIESKCPETKLTRHHHDVEIIHLPTIDSARGNDFYSLVTFWNDNETTKERSDFFILTDTSYDRVSWFWEKDSILNFTMFNTQNDKKESHIYSILENGNSRLQTVVE